MHQNGMSNLKGWIKFCQKFFAGIWKPQVEVACHRAQSTPSLCARYGHVCDSNASCSESDDSYQCVCHDGFTGTGKVRPVVF